MSKNVKIQNQIQNSEKLQPTDFSVVVSLPCTANKYCGSVTVSLFRDGDSLFTHSFDFVNSVVIDNYVQTTFQLYQHS